MWSLLAGTPSLASRALYPQTKALRTGHHAVGAPHQLYYEVHGKAGGAPALFLHGGPGAGCSARHAGFFDPSHYQIVLFDQRGCGKSTPRGCLVDNDTPNLIADIESLRQMLCFERWSVVVGGSWGTTLALAYAQAHPESVDAMVVRAVCLMRQREIRWLFGSRGGAAQLSPDGWRRFAEAAPGRVAAAAAMEAGSVVEAAVETEASVAADAASTALAATAVAEVEGADLDVDEDDEAVLRMYADALSGAAEDPTAATAAARGWMTWEGAITSLGAGLKPCPTPAAQGDADDGAAAGAGAAGSGSDGKTGCWAWVPAEQQWRLCDATSGKPTGTVLDATAVAEALCEGFQPRVREALGQRSPSQAAVGAVGAAAGATAGWVAGKAKSALQKGGGSGSGSSTSASAAADAKGAANGSSGSSGSSGGSKSGSSGGGGGGPWVPAQAMLTSRYSTTYGFLGETELLLGVDRIRQIPCVAVQGANDMICPPATAHELHLAWPEMELRVAPGAGHSMYSAELQAEVLRATDAFRDRGRPEEEGGAAGGG